MEHEDVIKQIDLHAGQIMRLLGQVVPKGYRFAFTVDHGREYVVEFMREDESHHEAGGGPDAADVLRYAFNERLPPKQGK